MPLLAALRYTVWAPNLRGYGQSSRPPKIADYNITHLIDDAACLIDAARAEGINGAVTLMTHDWGGAIGWSFVLTEARPLDLFVVLNLPHPAQFLTSVSGWAQLTRSWSIFFFPIPWLPEKLMTMRGAPAIGDAFSNMALDQTNFGPEVLAHYRENALIPGAMKAMINYYRASFRKNPLKDIWENPPQVKVPTLMVWGEADVALGQELTYGTEDLVDNFTLRYLPNVSHWVKQEAPETVNVMLEAWLTDKAVPEASEVSET